MTNNNKNVFEIIESDVAAIYKRNGEVIATITIEDVPLEWLRKGIAAYEEYFTHPVRAKDWTFIRTKV